MPDHLQYLALMAACLAITAPLEFVFSARVYRQPRRLALAMAPMLVVFLTWDAIGIAHGTWWYNPRFITGITLPLGIPLEELVFFIVIPICGLLTYASVGTVLSWWRSARGGRPGDANA